MANSVSQQNQQPMPRIDTPFIEPGTPDIIQRTWWQLLLTLWRRAGCGPTSILTADFVVLQAPNAPNGPLEAVLASTGQSMGTIGTSTIGGNTPIQLVVTVSPFPYNAETNGTLIVYGTATMSISRDNGPFYGVSDVGGALPMLAGDQSEITWSGTAPQVTFFPGG